MEGYRQCVILQLTLNIVLSKSMSTLVDVWEGRVVKAVQSRRGNTYVYEGCPILLADGEVCALSVSRRQQDNQVLVCYRHDRREHVCCAKGRGIPLYGFSVRIMGHELHVWEKGGTKLLGLSGIGFARTMVHWWLVEEGAFSVRNQSRMAINFPARSTHECTAVSTTIQFGNQFEFFPHV